jgi:hypothetical protein
MSDVRNTGGNKLSRNGERLDTYGRRSDDYKEKIVTRTDGSKVDKYWGGQRKPDGAGHGHEWNNKKDGEKGIRQPNR